MLISKDIIEKMESGSHFDEEVAMNMTSLVEILSEVYDIAFTVCFIKQPSVEATEEFLDKYKYAELKDKKRLDSLVKDILEGNQCTMTCHLVKVENHLGRSTVIDLGCPNDNKFR